MKFSAHQHQFRARAYQNAASILHDLPQDISHYLDDHHLQEIKGIGEGDCQEN